MTPVIIPILNGRELTKACIKSVLAQDVPVEVYVIDNGSTDGSAEMLRSWGDNRVHYIPARRPSVAAAWNYGLDYLFTNGADRVLVLNNDTALRPDTVRLLLAENAMFVTCVGNSDPKSVEGPWNPPTNAPRPHPDFSCYMISRECYDEVGRFDEKFIGGYCEDGDFHVRMHKAGVRAYCIDIPFYHLGAGTIKKSEDATGIQTQADRNRAYFKQKWGCEVGSKEYYAMFGHGAPDEAKDKEEVHEEKQEEVKRGPIVNVVMVTNGARPRLLQQAQKRLFATLHPDLFTLTTIWDGYLNRHELEAAGCLVNSHVVAVWPPVKVLSRLKRLGVYWSEQQFGRGDYLCIVDDDVAFLPGWIDALVAGLTGNVKLVGGDRHPYHGVNDRLGNVQITDAVAGYCHFMTWDTWDKYGPYTGTAQGIGQSEDFAFCRKIVDAGYLVGYVTPSVVVHCGITNSKGEPAIGSGGIKRVEGVLYE